MKKLLFFIFLIPSINISQGLEFSPPNQQGVSDDRIKLISQLSEKYVKDNKVANITTILNRNGKIVYYESFGDRGFSDERKVKKDDLYRIYSMTKPKVVEEIDGSFGDSPLPIPKTLEGK